MASLTARRAVCVSTSVLRPLGIAPAVVRSPRLLHESAKAKAVEAVVPQAASSRSHLVQRQPLGPAGRAVPPGQLDVTAQLHKPGFYETVSRIMDIRHRYVRDRFVFVESRDMIPLVLGLGADPDDLARIERVSDILYGDPTLPFCRSRSGRFCTDYDAGQLRRLEFQPFVLTAAEDFKRYDSGQLRRFDEIQDNLQLNSVLQALFAFKALVMHGVPIAQRPGLDYSSNKWVCTLFNLRTFTNSAVLGEPALEGVHSDGVDHTMTTYLGSNNMAPNSAATFMHDMAETTGIRVDDTSPHHVLSRVQHRDLLDTLVIVDHERKHSLTPVFPVDKAKEATRDMLIFFTRKPAEKTHVSGGIDSFNAHRELPMEIPLFIPGRQQGRLRIERQGVGRVVSAQEAPIYVFRWTQFRMGGYA